MGKEEIHISDDAGPLEREIGRLLVDGEIEEATRRLEEEYTRLSPALEYDDEVEE